jgi:hypothetical protein
MGVPGYRHGAGYPGPVIRGRRSEMKSTEVISAPDYPFRGTVWPQFSKKRHPDSGNRPFQSPIASLTIIPCPEMATFGNDTGRFSGTSWLVHGAGLTGKETLTSHWSGLQPITATGPAAGNIRGKMYRRRMYELVEEINPL